MNSLDFIDARYLLNINDKPFERYLHRTSNGYIRFDIIITKMSNNGKRTGYIDTTIYDKSVHLVKTLKFKKIKKFKIFLSKIEFV